MALAHHDAAHRDKAQSPDAELFGAENRGDDDVAPGLEPTVGAQPDAVAEAVERENLIDFGQAHFPRRAGIFDAGLGRGAGEIGRAHSELQSLMRSSYAVFCWQKKHNTERTRRQTT